MAKINSKIDKALRKDVIENGVFLGTILIFGFNDNIYLYNNEVYVEQFKFEGDDYISFTNSWSLVLTKEDCGEIELFNEENNWKTKLEAAKSKCYSKLDDFDKLQDEEMKKFDEKWDDPNYLRLYSIPSTQLNQLRKIEKKLVLTKRYTDAAEVRKRIDIMLN